MQEPKVLDGAEALEHARHHPRDRVVARADALRAHSVLARVDALQQRLPALRHRHAGIVQVELPEKVGLAVRTVHSCPFLFESKQAVEHRSGQNRFFRNGKERMQDDVCTCNS